MVEDLIRRARRRLILNESLSQAAFAASVTGAGLSLLLILGTTFLEWWTLALFALAGVAIGIYRAARRVPNAYATAVQLDQNAQLHDALSTALHFSSAQDPKSDGFREGQHEQAEKVAGSVHLESAVPFTWPRALYAMAALCLLATGLAGLRYRTGHGIDLRRPLTEVLFEDQATRTVVNKGKFQNSKPGTWTDEADNLLAKLGIKPEREGPSPSDPDALEQAIDKALQQQPGTPAGKDSKGGDAQKATQGKDGSASDNTPGGDPIDSGEKNAGDPKDGSKGGSKDGDPNSKTGAPKNGDNSKESLMSKLKDAVSNMLSKSKTDQADKEQKPGQQKSEQQGAPKKSDKKSDGSNQSKPKDGSADSDSDDSDDPKSDSQGGDKGQGKESTASNQKQSQAGSGIGTQDGSKEAKAAEQLKAMGKISEIIGKRSTTVTGETMVEVQSGSQSLHTAYSTTKGAHGETDGDVTRDEIPVASQAYVQQYFKQVRKAVPNAGAEKAIP